MSKELMKKVQEAINKNKLTEYMIINLANKILKRPYKEGEKIDIVFLFQAASFWPSWETVWEACVEDERINPIMLVCDRGFKQEGLNQFRTAKKFLEEKGIPYKDVYDVNLDELNPHIILLHTPYDGQRPRYLQGKQLSARGHRVVYITYGIEIADTAKARVDHFTTGVVTTAWRLYTFSKEMIPYYKMFSPTGGDMVRSFGHPKFDRLDKKYFPSLPEYIKEKAKGRKILLLKVHFPKKVNGKMITPSLDMYMNFIKKIPEYKNLFCIFMPHPKFYEELAKFKDVNEWKEVINSIDNMIEYTEDDYRPVLLNCDYYIVDRSSLMIEAGMTGRPVCYVSRKDNPEPMTEPVQRIIDTYYQANCGKDLENFMRNIVIPDKDPLKEEREKAIRSVIPDTKGKSGYLIKEDMVNSLINDTIVDTKSLSLTEEFKEMVLELYRAKEIQEALIEEEREKLQKIVEEKDKINDEEIRNLVMKLFKEKEEERISTLKDLQKLKDTINKSNEIFTKELKEFIKELYEAKNIEDIKIKMAEERIKSHLSYRLGKAMIEASKEPFGFLKLPFKLKKAYDEFKKDKK